jgi:exosortase
LTRPRRINWFLLAIERGDKRVAEREGKKADLGDDQPGKQKGAARGWLSDRGLLVKLAVALAALVWAYAPNFRDLSNRWNEDPDYSHGYLVIPVALAILWWRQKEKPVALSAPSAWGWLIVVVALVARAIFYEMGKNWLETVTFLAVIAGLVLALGGGSLGKRTWPAIAYLGFMLPLPPGLDNALSLPLQRLATQGSCLLLRLTGLWVIAEGNVIDVGDNRLEVATACNGLSMLMMLAATITALVLLRPLAPWRRVVLLASIIPVALLSNILRITATAWCYHIFGAGRGAHYAHDWAGYLMMPTALLLVGLEMALLSWFFTETVEKVPAQNLGPLLITRGKPGMAKAAPGGFENGAKEQPTNGSVGVEDAIH